MLLFTLLSLAFLLHPSTAQSNNTCYSVDGQVLGDIYKPCNPSAQFSACCALNGTSPDNDICLDSGLCQSTSGWFAGFIWADGCTDQTGKADNCPQVCSHMPEQYSWNILQCNPGVFCCRAAYDKNNCCNTSAALFNTSHIGTLLLPNGKEANTTFVAPASASSCAAAAAAASPSAATVGGAVGGVLGAALLVALTTVILLLRRRKTLTQDLNTRTAQLTAAYEQQQTLKEKLDASPPYPSPPMQQPFHGMHGQAYFHQGALGGAPLTGEFPGMAVTGVPPQGANFVHSRPYEMDARTPSEMDGTARAGPGAGAGYHGMSNKSQSESVGVTK